MADMKKPDFLGINADFRLTDGSEFSNYPSSNSNVACLIAGPTLGVIVKTWLDSGNYFGAE